VSLSAGARLDTGTIGAGQGGSIAVNAGTLSLTGPGSGLFSDTGPFLGAPANSGVGGNIDVVAKNVSVQDGATISANSRGTASALAGNINVAFGDTLQLTNSNITTESLLADGGNITITSTGSTLYLLNGQILTSVQSGLGAGGNITIGTSAHPLSFLVLNNGGIHANAFGGPGGNINIFSDSFFTNVPVATAITASSALSAPGTINISATITDVSGSLAELPSGLFTAAALLRASCASRLAEGKASSLVVEGREGVPLEPDGLLPSGVVEGGVAPRTSTSDPVVSAQLAPLRLAYFDDRCRR
jgi:hypothetical protein